MADENKINSTEFLNLAKEIQKTNQDNLTLVDRRLRVNKELVNNVRELNQVAADYNKLQENSESILGRIKKATQDYSEETRKVAEAEVKAFNRKKDLQKRIGEIENKLAKNAAGNLKLTRNQVKEEYRKLQIAKTQLGSLEASIVKTQELKNKLKASADEQYRMGTQVKKFLEGVGSDLIGALGFQKLVNFFGQSNKLTVEFAKTLGTSLDNAADIRAEFAKIAFFTDKAAISSLSLTQSTLELAKNTGIVAGFSVDQITAQTTLTKLVGLTAGTSSKLIEFGELQNINAEKLTANILQQVAALEAETGLRVDQRRILAEVAKITGQLGAQYEFNAEKIAEAVLKTEQLGITLQQAAKIGDSLLQFEKSIGDELTAELLTGKQLNLERARLLALQGDSAEAAAEVVKQIGSAEEFTKMNVLQQRSLASAVGLTVDELSDSIKKQELINRFGTDNLKQIKESGRLEELRGTKAGEQLYQDLQRQAITEQYADILLKIQSTVVSIAESFKPIANLINSILDSSTFMSSIYLALGASVIPKVLGGFTRMIRLSKIFMRFAQRNTALEIVKSFVSTMGPLGILAGGAAIAGTMAMINSLTPADDFMSGPVGRSRVITAPEGSFALNDRDTVIAGTNLGGGGGGTNDPGREDRFINKLANAINTKRVVFDSFTASGPDGMYETDRRRQNLTFL